MKRGGYIKRYTPLRQRNPTRSAESFVRNYGDRGEAVRAMQCLVLSAALLLMGDDPGIAATRRYQDFVAVLGSCSGGIHAAHARARQMGGRGGDRRELIPLCQRHHAMSHLVGTRTFEERLKLKLRDQAALIAADLDERGLA